MASQQARKIVEGVDEKNEKNVQALVADTSGTKDIVADIIVKEGAVSRGTIVGGNYTVFSGDDEGLKRVLETQEKLNDRKIFVTVNFPEDLSPKFEQKFQPNDKIINVRSALKEDRKKLYFLVREKQLGVILPDTLPVVDIKDDLLAYENKDEALKVEK